MKFNKIFLSLAVGALFAGAAACTEEVEYTPAEPVPVTDYYFPTTNPMNRDLVDGDDSFEVTVCRPTAGAAATLAIESSVTPDNPFTIPTSVAFAEGESTASIKVEFDLAEVTVNQEYTVKLTIPGVENTPYSYGSMDIKVIYLPWRKMEEKGKYRDGVMASVYKGFTPVTYEVEIQQHPTIDGIYRLVNPYSPEVHPLVPEQLYDATTDHYVVIDARNPKRVFIEQSGTGIMDPTDGEMYINSWSNLLLEGGNSADAIEANGLYATLENGIIRYPNVNPKVNQAVLATFAEDPTGNPYIANTNNMFKVVLPGYEDEPEWEEIGMCDYTDGFVGPFIGVKGNTYKVLVERSLLTEGLYRIVNPYGPESGYTDKVPEITDYLEFTITDPDFVYFPEYEPGIQVNDAGNYLICATYPYIALNFMKKEDGSRYTESELKAAGFGGKFKDGVLVIPGDEAAGLNVTPAGQIAGLLQPERQFMCDIVLDMSNPVKSEKPAKVAAVSDNILRRGMLIDGTHKNKLNAYTLRYTPFTVK